MKCNRIRITLYDKLSSLRSIKGKSPIILSMSEVSEYTSSRLDLGCVAPLWLFGDFDAYDNNRIGGTEGMNYMQLVGRDKQTLSYKSKENFN